MNTLIENIGELCVVPRGPVGGARMGEVLRVRGAALVVEDERIAWYGPAGERPGELRVDERFDAGGGCLVPGLIDCHTHVVFAGMRDDEFVMRNAGKSYAEIAAAGGGIRTTVNAVRAATRAQLVELARPRLARMLAGGVTTVEVKGGYGLTVADEVKILEAAQELGAVQPVEIVGTWLAAHVVPKDRRDEREAYLRETHADAVLADVRARGLAEFVDVFVEAGAFTVEEGRFVLEAGRRHGLRGKVHAEQLSNTGATAMAAALGAVSADHLEFVDDEAIASLRTHGTIPVVLPGCSLFLNSAPAPARRLIEAGLPLALATDFNPGSSMIESLQLILAFSCVRLGLTPAEALVACTANAAAALARADRIGHIAVGAQADLALVDVPRLEAWPYQVGRNCVRAVWKRGRVVHSAA